MAKESFTFDEVDALIPQLEYHFQKLLLHKKEMAAASHRLRGLGATPQLIGVVSSQSTPEVHQLQGEVRRHYRQYKEHLFAIENMGGEIKDLELGRVDFPTRHEGEDALYTWQLGVTDGPYLQVKEAPKEEEPRRVKYEMEANPDLI